MLGSPHAVGLMGSAQSQVHKTLALPSVHVVLGVGIPSWSIGVLMASCGAQYRACSDFNSPASLFNHFMREICSRNVSDKFDKTV